MRTLLEAPFSLSANKRPAHEAVVSPPQPTSLQLLALTWVFHFLFDDDFPLDESCCTVGIVGAENCTC